jgi:hypothetical protein
LLHKKRGADQIKSAKLLTRDEAFLIAVSIAKLLSVPGRY